MAEEKQPTLTGAGDAGVPLGRHVALVLCALISAVGCHPERTRNNRPEPKVDTSGMRPVEALHGSYVGSESCRECHAHEHDSWHDSYHRTMTQVAGPETVIGDFSDVRLQFPGQDGFKQFRLWQDGGQYWAEFDSPGDVGRSGDRMTLPVVMTTGSHHMQAY